MTHLTVGLFSFLLTYVHTMTNVQIQAAHRINAAFTRQTKSKMVDLLNLRHQTKTIKVIIA